jgi:hypothetical protein
MTASVLGVTPRFTPRGARELIDDIDVLLDHLGRAVPGRLEACFEDSRGTTARGTGIADPPKVMPADGAGGAAENRTKVAFIEHLAEIADRVAKAAVQAGGDQNVPWTGFVQDLAFLLQARDFLATLAQPATVDTIRLTRAYVDETIRQRKRGTGRRSSAGEPSGDRGFSVEADGSTSVGDGAAPRNHAEIGLALAGRMAGLRRLCSGCVVATLLISLYAFTGKVLLDEGERTQGLLGRVAEDISAAINTEAMTTRRDAPFGAPAATTARPAAYCDQPFLADDGAVRYASTHQEALCNRLWGVNGYANRLNGHLDAWSAPFVYSPLGWFFGVTSLRDALPPILTQLMREPNPQRIHLGGTVRVFAENARLASFRDALALASERAQEVRTRSTPSTLPAFHYTAEGGGAATPDPRAGTSAGLLDSARAQDPLSSEAARIVTDARQRFVDLGYRERDYLLPAGNGISSPLQAKAVIAGVGLYVMPCLYALLGAFVAVFRNIARKSDAALLDRSDHDRAAQTLTLGVVFGAVIGLIADMLRGGAAGQPADGATVMLSVSALALLAGYSVGHVFGLLDDISERVFGRRDAAGRPEAAR